MLGVVPAGHAATRWARLQEELRAAVPDVACAVLTATAASPQELRGRSAPTGRRQSAQNLAAPLAVQARLQETCADPDTTPYPDPSPCPSPSPSPSPSPIMAAPSAMRAARLKETRALLRTHYSRSSGALRLRATPVALEAGVHATEELTLTPTLTLTLTRTPSP